MLTHFVLRLALGMSEASYSRYGKRGRPAATVGIAMARVPPLSSFLFRRRRRSHSKLLFSTTLGKGERASERTKELARPDGKVFRNGREVRASVRPPVRPFRDRPVRRRG